MPAPKKYFSEEERQKAYKDQQNKYSKKKIICDVCQIMFNLGNKTSHLRSSTHLKVLNIS